MAVDGISLIDDDNVFVSCVSNYARTDAKNDIINYNKYLSGELDTDNYKINRDMKILFILDSLGYPLNELGTFLYKDVIGELYDFVLEIDKSYDLEKYNQMLEYINDAFSCFYHTIAREDKDMGVKPFHLCIQRAIDKIDEDKVDRELSMKIFGNKNKELDYGMQAFLLASFIAGQYEYINIDSYNKPKIKKLESFPKDISFDNYF